MQNLDYLKQYYANLERIEKLDVKSLIRKEELGLELNFSSAEDDFERSINLFKGLINVDISSLPDTRLKELNASINEFFVGIDLVLNYNASQGKPERDGRISRMKTGYDKWYNIISPIIAYCTKAGTDYDALQRKAREALDEFNTLQEQAKAEREQAKRDIEETKMAVQKAAAEVGVTQHTTNFKEAADYFDEQRKFWMQCVIGVSGLIIMYALGSFVWFPMKMCEPYLYTFLQAALPRFTGLVVLFYLLAVATNNYRAQAHNYIVNKNKQNALSTFETFVKATDDDEIKNAVLMQTTKAIFSNTQSGYLKNECSSEETSQIIEIVKDASKFTKS